MGCCVNLSHFTSFFFTHPVLHSGVKVARTVPVEETRKLHGATGWSADGMTQKLVEDTDNMIFLWIYDISWI